jgi:hypothetical protein
LLDPVGRRKKIDARTANPDQKWNGKTLKSLVKKYDDVTSGKASIITVPKKDIRKYQKAGFETTQKTKVIVPHGMNEKVIKQKTGFKVINKTGIERVIIPIEFKDIKSFAKHIRKNSKAINAMKGRNEYFGIRFHGGQRANFYSDILALQADLEKYDVFLSSKPKQQEAYRHLEILRISKKVAKRIEQSRQKKVFERTRKQNKLARRRYRSKKIYTTSEKEVIRQQNAEAQKRFRDKLKGAAKKLYQKKAKDRAKKSRKKHRSSRS